MSGLILSIAAGVIPMILYAGFLYYLDRYEKEPIKLLAGMFLWGSLIAAGISFLINSVSSLGFFIITQSDLATQLATSTFVAPLVEETLKGAAILIVFLLFHPEFDSPLDGIVYGGIAALGFAATENVWYIHQFGYLPGGVQGLLEISLIRVVLVGWQHPFYTAFTGLGFALSRQSKDKVWQWIYPLIGWSFAVMFHLLHNLFAVLASNTGNNSTFNLVWDWSGYLGLFVLILLLIRREQKWMKVYLAQEMENGLINSHQYQIACSAWRQGLTYLSSILRGNFLQSRRFYQVCGDLMHISRHSARFGDSPDNIKEAARLRSLLTSLSSIV
jgi:RsiW-degrading membrane proteinase PrsW (M82 family)